MLWDVAHIETAVLQLDIHLEPIVGCDTIVIEGLDASPGLVLVGVDNKMRIGG